MANASWALQQAVFARLTSDEALTELLGGARVYDDVPVRAAFPYVTFAQGAERDWSTASESGAEHALVLHAYSRASERNELLAIMEALRALLHDAALALTGYRLVNLRHEASDVRRENDGETYHGIVRLRAVTEANSE
jgi:hypothetical protein